MIVAGTLVLVVGQSGVGKDSLMRYAAASLRTDARFVFARRVITRPCDGQSELHDTLGVAQFHDAFNDGAFALHWKAHGFDYGVPASILPALEAGRTVVVNASRRIVSAAAERFPNCVVLNITASPDVIAARLKKRGRETAEAIATRTARTASEPPSHVRTVTIDNGGDLPVAGERVVTVLLKTYVSPHAATV